MLTSRAGRAAGLVLAVLPALACAAGEPSIEGYWTGAIELPSGQPLEITIDVVRTDEVWSATFYAPAQGIHGVELADVEIAGRSAQFRIPQARGEPTFQGEMAGDGRTLAGEFTDAEQTMPFSLTRAERPEGLGEDFYAEYRQPGVAGEGLAGAWRALLVTGPNRVRLRLDVWPAEEDRLTGSLTTLDQDSPAQPADGFLVEGNKVQFEMLGIGAMYQGKMLSIKRPLRL